MTVYCCLVVVVGLCCDRDEQKWYERLVCCVVVMRGLDYVLTRANAGVQDMLALVRRFRGGGRGMLGCVFLRVVPNQREQFHAPV